MRRKDAGNVNQTESIMNHRSFPPTEFGSSWTDADDVRCDIYSGRCVLLLGISIAAGLTACQLIDYPQADRLLPTLALAAAFLMAGWAVLRGKLDRLFPWSGARGTAEPAARSAARTVLEGLAQDRPWARRPHAGARVRKQAA